MTAMTRLTVQVSGQVGHTDNYCAAIRGAGGEPVAGYCPTPDLSCAGLVLCGGGDIEYTRYTREDRGSQPPDRARDESELILFRAFYQAGKPILGICRGMQLINVALGGTLIQNLPDIQQIFHRGKEDMVHPVRAEEGSTLYRLYGSVFSVNSAHHQALDSLSGVGGVGLVGERFCRGYRGAGPPCSGRTVPPGADVLRPVPAGHCRRRRNFPLLFGPVPG